MEQNQQTPVVQPTKMSGRTKAGLWCLIGPTGLLIATFALYAIFNLIFAASVSPTIGSESLFAETPVAQSLLNVVWFIMGLVGILAWFPGVIIGIVLLATKKPTLPPQA